MLLFSLGEMEPIIRRQREEALAVEIILAMQADGPFDVVRDDDGLYDNNEEKDYLECGS